MAKINIKRDPIYTQEGAIAKHINPSQQLRRSVMACMLWENEFYEDGQSITSRISDACQKVKPEELAALAIEARTHFKLRHVPLLLARELARGKTRGTLVGKTIASVIQRADELTEFLAIYWKDGRCPLSAQVKRGLQNAFRKFNGYQLAKYNRDGKIKLRDVLFLCHAKPKNEEQAQIWKQLIAGTLTAPDTWEVALSGGADKKITFERLLSEKKLGYLALLRNLRNMRNAGVGESLIFASLHEGAKNSKALPFRFIAAARAVPQWEPEIDKAMLQAMNGIERISGKTVILVDNSGSMDASLSAKSDLMRRDAAYAVAILTAGVCEKTRVFAFSDSLAEVPPRQGMALADALKNATEHSSTYLGEAVHAMNKIEYDRLVVITDEQSHDRVPDPVGRGYMINVASNKNGVGYGKWIHIDGFSEAVIDYIREFEKACQP